MPISGAIGEVAGEAVGGASRDLPTYGGQSSIRKGLHGLPDQEAAQEDEQAQVSQALARQPPQEEVAPLRWLVRSPRSATTSTSPGTSPIGPAPTCLRCRSL